MRARFRAARLILFGVHPALCYLPGDRLTLAELGAARLDGHVVEVGECFAPADTVESAEMRVAGLRTIVPARTAACGPTAAWVHGAGDRPPVVHHVRRSSIRRFRPALPGNVVYHEGRVDEEDLLMIAGVPVATELAAATDLLFWVGADATAEGWLRGLLQVSAGLDEALQERLERMPRRPGRRAAIETLRRIRTS